MLFCCVLSLFAFDKCTMVIYDANIRRNWVWDGEQTLSLQHFYKHNPRKLIKNNKVNRNLTSDKQEGKHFKVLISNSKSNNSLEISYFSKICETCESVSC